MLKKNIIIVFFFTKIRILNVLWAKRKVSKINLWFNKTFHFHNITKKKYPFTSVPLTLFSPPHFIMLPLFLEKQETEKKIQFIKSVIFSLEVLPKTTIIVLHWNLMQEIWQNVLKISPRYGAYLLIHLAIMFFFFYFRKKEEKKKFHWN